MSSGSVASAGKRPQNDDNSPGGEGASCGACRRVDTSRMVQCDECDVWFHYDCVDVDDHIGDRDWSCNRCMRKSLEKQQRILREQFEHFEQRMKQWQQGQQNPPRQIEEQQEHAQRQKQPELQQRMHEQFDQSQIGKLQLQQQNLPSEMATGVPQISLGAIPKQQQQVQCMDNVESTRQGRAKPLANSTVNNESEKACSKSSKHSTKRRELQLKALAARQALEKKQLEERLELEREMLETSDSESESAASFSKISEWIETTDNIGKNLGKSNQDTPLPVYSELLRKSVAPTKPINLHGDWGPIRPSNIRFGAGHFPFPYIASQQEGESYVPDSRNIAQPRVATSASRPNPAIYRPQAQRQLSNDQLPLNSGHLAARQTVKDLPKFGGDPEDWPRFIAAYERTSRMCAFRNDELLDRLERSLQDKALCTVKSLLLHPDNVPVIMNRLKTLFGNPELIVETMVRRIRMMPPPKADKMETIVDFGVAVQNLCATIQVCQMDERLYNVALLQELVDSLPSALKMKWAFYRKEIRTATLLEFNEWLGEMVETLSQVIRPTVWTKPQKAEQKTERRVRKEEVYLHTHTTHSSDQVDRKGCLACGNECSSLDKCGSFLKMSPSARWALVNVKKVCRKCLNKHFKTCERKVPCGVQGCAFLHHRLLHNDSKHNKPSISHSTQAASINAHHSSLERTFLKYISVTVHGKGSSISTYAFLDAGSTSTLMEHSLWEELNLDGERAPLCISWTGGQGRYEDDSVVFSVEVTGERTPGLRFNLQDVHTVRSLDLPSQSMSATELAEHFGYLSDIPIESYADVKPRILLGVDNSRLEYPLDSREGSENQPTAVLTRLGWVVYGPCSMSGRPKPTDVSYSYHICQCDGLHSAVKNYFSIDGLGIQLTGKPLMSKDDERAIQLLQTKTLFKNGRYETGLLWRYDEVRLPESKAMALRRHECLSKRMAREPQLAKALQEKILDYRTKGYIRMLTTEEEAVHKGRSWYLPIFPVVNPNKPGKLRIVWDAAAKVGNLSLNSFLLKGPDQVTPLQQVLQRFREHRTAVSGDIREMFHQVRINPNDQHCQRFLWNDGVSGSVPSTYVMEVMTFGASCSPSSAQYVKNLNAERFKDEYPEAVEAIGEGTYVDDMLYSVETEDEAVKLAQDVRNIHAKGGFEIRGWLSNSKKVLDAMGEQRIEQKDLNKTGELATEKVLGMWWDTTNDTFTFKIPKRCEQRLLFGEQVPTKREVLRVLMSVYDPLGLLANVMMFLKVLLQEIWRSCIGWDEPITDQQFVQWKTWLGVLHTVEQVSIPRCYRMITSCSSKTNDTQLHVFVDASEKGYAAVAYFRFEEKKSIECAFVTAKTRVAPLKYVSIPRLELQAAVIGTRLANSVCETHKVPVRKRFLWTDSRDVLCWLRSDHRKYSKFVGARVGEILESTEQSEWLWVPTKENVADEGTKWQKIPDLSPSSRWFKGPAFLWQQQRDWPVQPANHGVATNEIIASVNVHATCEPVISFVRYSNWRKLLRVTAYVLRFVRNVRARVKQHTQSTGALEQPELLEAECCIYRQVQLDAFSEEVSLLKCTDDITRQNIIQLPKSSSLYKLSPFLDTHGVLRMRGRTAGCQFINDNAGHTILLPKDHPVTSLIIQYVHERYHHLNHETTVNELRQKYRIAKLRTICNKVRRSCQYCKNSRARPQPPVMADLPPARLAAYTRPFSYAGIDYFGPMQVVVGRRTEKRWGVLITCLVIRAIHIELAHSLNTSSCVMALRNFMARRGTPLELYSDRGTNFVGANRELTEAVQNLNQNQLMKEFVTPDTKWTFLPPSSPHMGGCWERMVQSVKKVLNNMQLPRTPTDEVLRNFLLEAENIVNSRPLTYVPVEDSESEALTPNHFLLGSSGGTKPLVPYDDSLATLKNSWKASQIYANIFWKRWLREYLPTISRRTKWHYPVKPIQVGDVVLIVDPDLPRNSWPLGRVIDVNKRNGQVRSATVQTRFNIYERPAVKLAVLDVGASESTQGHRACVLGGNVTQSANAPPLPTNRIRDARPLSQSGLVEKRQKEKKKKEEKESVNSLFLNYF
ncbi:uncharacterized protein LOC131425755 [Malaya genurostris]|uniref:uncharacterized protein LOC131425755 n=1 Tax=Malaya genurostris TaxID=325434 RepID=UPI0026F3CB2D|nr:uncharacterized protein LOC131425755 [Malaya genurostris]XP_058443869.1 uncharacterized protein LOC131425755 [Malaya genurostris]